MSFAMLPSFEDLIRAREQRQCLGKAGRYNGKKKALRRAAQIAKESGEQMGAYWCCFCGGWHLGHSKTAERYEVEK